MLRLRSRKGVRCPKRALLAKGILSGAPFRFLELVRQRPRRRFALGLGVLGLPVRPAVGKPLTLRPDQRERGALLIVHAQRDAVGIPEIKLRQIAVQVLFRAVLINALHAALEDGEEAFDLSGIGPQCLYSLAGYDASTSQGTGLVQLWGIVRDLSSPNHFRATGLALQLFNDAVQSESHAVLASQNSSLDGISAAAFHGPAGWSVVIVSSRPASTMLTLRFPKTAGQALPQVEAMLATVDRQNGDNVVIRRSPLQRIATAADTIRVEIPSRDMVVLLPAISEGATE